MNYADLISTGTEADRRHVTVEHLGDRAIVRLDDPGKRNVLSAAMMVHLHEETDRLLADEQVRSIILTGTGSGFSTGGDLRMMGAFTEALADGETEEGAFAPYQFIRYQFGGIVRKIAHSDKAWIAALNGPAAGVGLAFALTCDIAIASRGAVLVPAFGKLGLVPEVGTSWALTRALGYRRAFQFYVGGEHLDAESAAELGLINEVVEDDALIDRALVWCDKISGLPDHALPIAKPLLRQSADASWDQSLAMEELAEPMCFTTRGFANGVKHVVAATSGGG
jgi:2-(1,2-epoxy-1,2-dihydrophenyl)acetyl-CoA isomerase